MIKIKSMKKLVGMLLAMAMVLGLCGTAFAADAQPMASSPTTTGSITINGAVAGEQYTIYQIFEVTYSDDVEGVATEDSSYSYKVVDEWKNFIESYQYIVDGSDKYLFTLDANGYLDVSSAIFDEIDNSEVMVKFAKDALTFAKGPTGISGTTIGFSYDFENEVATAYSGCFVSNVVEGENGIVTATVTISGLDLGYYLVGTSLGTLCMLDTTNNEAVIDEKNPTPTLDKYVRDITEKDEENDYTQEDNTDVIDTLEYEIIISDIANSTNLCLHDVIDDDMILDKDSITVYLGDISSRGDKIDPANYTIYTESNYTGENWDGCCFEIEFRDDFLEGLSEDSVIYVIYTVTLSEDIEWEGEIHDFRNVAHLTYGNATSTPGIETDTYSYGFEIHKYTTVDNETKNLADAEFVVKYVNGDTTYYAQFRQETGYNYYVLTGWVQEKNDATVLKTPDSGTLYVEGFDPDTIYYIEEVAAPDGYNMLTGDITVEIQVNEELKTNFTIVYTYGDTEQSAENHVIEVLNNTGSILPGTGGMGTTIFYIIGIIVVAGAVILLVTRRRMNRAA